MAILSFTTTGAVIKHEEYSQRSINLKVDMPNGDMRDLLRLAMKGPPFMEGFINMKSSIDIPPLTSKVKQKLVLDGTFDLQNARFLKSTIQDQIDQLSRRGQGHPKDAGDRRSDFENAGLLPFGKSGDDLSIAGI